MLAASTTIIKNSAPTSPRTDNFLVTCVDGMSDVSISRLYILFIS